MHNAHSSSLNMDHSHRGMFIPVYTKISRWQGSEVVRNNMCEYFIFHDDEQPSLFKINTGNRIGVNQLIQHTHTHTHTHTQTL